MTPAPTALVTGATGQDGSYLVEALLAAGHEVHAYARPGSTGAVALAAARRGVVVHTGELQDPRALRAALEASRPGQVFHLAAISAVGPSWEDPLGVLRVNTLGTAALLQAVWEWSRAHGTDPALVHASSAAVFGAPASSPQDESIPIRPTSPYGASKAAAQHLTAVYRDRGMRASNAILFNHESPRRPPEFVTRKISRAVAAIAAGRESGLALGDLRARRDWGWAPDHVAAMRAMAAAPDPGDYVVATGESHTVGEFVAAAFAHVGLDPDRYVTVDPDLLRPAEAVELRGDATRLRTRLGWAPTVPFDQIVARMVDADRATL